MMPLPEINSVSSGLMLGLTGYRNHGTFGSRIGAQPSYAFVFAVSVIESIAALVFCTAVVIVYPLSEKPLESGVKWLSSSSFCIVWSAADFILNLLPLMLVADEASARWIARTGNIMTVPPGAVL